MTMSTRLSPLERELIERLRMIAEFELVGYRATPLPEGGIAISRRGNVRGVWFGGDDELRWRPSDSVAGGFVASTVDEALRRMMKIVLASLQIRASMGRRVPTAA